ncbi:MAG TPA: hypothetical protein DD490_16615 [Acidobacteria bacterium]|nr:hypothetical protein [Acidobacteriota bacterium]
MRSTFPRCLLLAGLVLIGGCYDKDDYVPSANETRLTLLSPSGTNTVAADGFSRLGLIARISPRADADRRTVVFSTSAGTLIGGTGVGATREVPADTAGEAFIELQSSQRVETALVTAGVKDVPGLTTNLTVSFVALDPNQILRFTTVPNGPFPADGATSTSFSVTLSGAVPPDANGLRTVQFTTTAGSFGVGGPTTIGVPADAGNVATVDLTSPSTITTGHLRATINGVTREVPLSFDRALPHRITVTTDTFSVAAGSQANLSVTLARDIGQVTNGTPVLYRAEGTAGELPSTYFQNATLSNSGTASVVFRPDSSNTYKGPVTITARVEGSGAAGSVRVEIP